MIPNAIRATCRTNIDEFKRCAWPKWFAAVPRVGEYVQGKGSPPVTMPTLKVVGVTHCEDDKGPYISVELHR